MQASKFHRIDMDKIEREARQMRAEATRDAFIALVSWVKSLFHTRQVKKHQAA